MIIIGINVIYVDYVNLQPCCIFMCLQGYSSQGSPDSCSASSSRGLVGLRNLGNTVSCKHTSVSNLIYYGLTLEGLGRCHIK